MPVMEAFQHKFIAVIFFFILSSFVVAASRVWKLRHIPGPIVCHCTDLLRVFHQARGQLLPWLTAVHEKYGTVVRIGPNCVSVSDPTKVPTIYTMHGEFIKVRNSICNTFTALISETRPIRITRCGPGRMVFPRDRLSTCKTKS